MHHSYIDEYSNIDSPIHRLDPRAKIVSFVGFMLFVIFTKPISFHAFFLYAFFLLGLILLSRLPLRFVLVRSLTIIPFVLMIALFIPFLKKGEVAGGYSLGSLKLVITYDGLIVFWNVLIKAYLSILCMILLVSTTKFAVFLKALEKLKIPKVIVMVLSFMYRYIFVIFDELMEMKRAKDARSVGGSRWFHAKALSNMLGVLFVRSYENGEAVYLAMCARGFSGTIKTLDRLVFKKIDLLFLITVFLILGGIIIFAG